MDEILDRIKATKVKRKYLIANLIATEILGILVFVWILRTPLYEKFLTLKPRSYSLTQMDIQKRYLLAQGDFLTKQADRNNRIVLLVWENGIVQHKVKIKPDSEGKWAHQLPQNIDPGVKILTVGELDQNNNILSVNNYRVRIKPRELLNLNQTEERQAVLDNLAVVQAEILNAASNITIQEAGVSLLNNVVETLPREE